MNYMSDSGNRVGSISYNSCGSLDLPNNAKQLYSFDKGDSEGVGTTMANKKPDSSADQSIVSSEQYASFINDIKARIRSAQYEALKFVNKELVALYWDIGRLIVERQQDAGWGKAIVEQLALDLQSEFPGTKGFSSQNLWRMRQLYEAYAANEKLSPLVREISWSHNLVILGSCGDDLQREFYLRTAKQQGWSKNVLIHQIETNAYERTLSSQTNFESTLPVDLQDRARLIVKDEYTFSFLSLEAEHEERELQAAILLRVEPFLKEMGGAFTFVGSQYRLEVSGKEYFIDLLLYHRKLKCLVAIELKVGEFIPEYVGKMQFYLAALDDLVRQNDETPSIGIIICKSKDRTTVEYTLRDARRPIGVSSYRVVSAVPNEMKGLLPAPEQIARLLKVIDEDR